MITSVVRNTVLFQNLKCINTFSKCLSTSNSVEPVKLAFATYENTATSHKEAPFVIVHGLFGSKQNWTSLCKVYSQKTDPPRKIIALDLRNHGESVHSDEHTYIHLAEDLKQFLIDHNIDKVALMGHSMGGRCAMLFALTYPQLVEKLIIVDVSPTSMTPQLKGMYEVLETMYNVEPKLPKNVPLSQARSFAENQLAKTISEKDVRSFILTNLVAADDTSKSYKWRVNVPVLLKRLNEISKFPIVSGAKYESDTFFIGGANSAFLPKIAHISRPKYLGGNIRLWSDLAQTQNYKNTVNLAYGSYQSTDSIFGKVKVQEVPTPLVVLHGILGSKANFNSLCKRYHENSKPKMLVYAVDSRNHGDSTHTIDNTYDDMVMDLYKFLKTMDLRKVNVMGHDIGGRVGMLLSLKYPDIVEKLIVVDMSPITTSHNFKVFSEVLRILNTIIFPPNLPLPQAKAHVVNCLSRVVKNKGLMSLVLANLVQRSDGSYTWRCNNKVLFDHIQELSSFPAVHNLRFDGQVLFIGGAKSDYIQKSDYPSILKLFPNAKLKYIEGAGHWVHAEKPNEFLKLTMDFLNKKTTSLS